MVLNCFSSCDPESSSGDRHTEFISVPLELCLAQEVLKQVQDDMAYKMAILRLQKFIVSAVILWLDPPVYQSLPFQYL